MSIHEQLLTFNITLRHLRSMFMRLEIYNTLQNVSNKSKINSNDAYILDYSPFFSDLMVTLLKEE